jgi:hypothetical protein
LDQRPEEKSKAEITRKKILKKMSRGVSSGGGKSSLDYLFESDQNPSLTEGTKKTTSPSFALDSDGKGRDNETNTTVLGADHSTGSRDQELQLGKAVRNYF